MGRQDRKVKNGTEKLVGFKEIADKRGRRRMGRCEEQGVEKRKGRGTRKGWNREMADSVGKEARGRGNLGIEVK